VGLQFAPFGHPFCKINTFLVWLLIVQSWCWRGCIPLCPSNYRCCTDLSTEVLTCLLPSCGFSWGHLFIQQIPEEVHTYLPYIIQVTDEATYLHSGVCILQGVTWCCNAPIVIKGSGCTLVYYCTQCVLLSAGLPRSQVVWLHGTQQELTLPFGLCASSCMQRRPDSWTKELLPLLEDEPFRTCSEPAWAPVFNWL